jgi:hypothetical protein
MEFKAKSLDGVFCKMMLAFALFPFVLLGQNAKSAAGEEPFLYLKVQLAKNVKPASLKPGEVVEGILTRGVYWREKEVIPADSHVSLVVDRLEQRKRPPNDHWPWVIKAFTPRHEKSPVFHSAHVLLPDGRTMDLQVSLLALGQRVEARRNSRKRQSNSHSSTASSDRTSQVSASPAGVTASLEALVNAADMAAQPGGQIPSSSAENVTVPAGTQAKVILLDSVSASGSRLGDTLHARLIEPVLVDSKVVIPAGTVLEGVVAKAQKPRVLSRAGSLLISFTSIDNPEEAAKHIDTSVADVSVDKRSHTKIDPEGQLQGDRPGVAWMLINLGVTGGLSKVADDTTQLIIEAMVSTATDASTAGTARIVAACVSGVFMLTRHGGDVVLPKFTEMDLTFNRPLAFSAVASSGNHREPNGRD